MGTFFYDVMPCHLVDQYQRFKQTRCLQLLGRVILKIQVPDSSEMMMVVY
jgi:hypothetical protein